MSGPLLLGMVSVPAMVPGGCVLAVMPACGSVKFEVVSAFVAVMAGGGSPGAVIVEFAAVDVPS